MSRFCPRSDLSDIIYVYRVAFEPLTDHRFGQNYTSSSPKVLMFDVKTQTVDPIY